MPLHGSESEVLRHVVAGKSASCVRIGGSCRSLAHEIGPDPCNEAPFALSNGAKDGNSAGLSACGSITQS